MKTVLVSGCLILGTILVIVQVVHSFVRQHAGAAIADLARSVSAMAESTADAVNGTDDAVSKLKAVHDDVTAKGGVPVEMTQAIQGVASATDKAKDTSEAAKKKAEDVARQASSVTSLLGDLSGRLPFAVMGLVFIIAGAWIGGMIDLSVMTKPQ